MERDQISTRYIAKGFLIFHGRVRGRCCCCCCGCFCCCCSCCWSCCWSCWWSRGRSSSCPDYPVILEKKIYKMKSFLNCTLAFFIEMWNLRKLCPNIIFSKKSGFGLGESQMTILKIFCFSWQFCILGMYSFKFIYDELFEKKQVFTIKNRSIVPI